MTERDCMLRSVMELGFALDDALLYLDTHAGDVQAMEYYLAMRDRYAAEYAAYVQQAAPLQMTDMPADGNLWVDAPWPWEMEG